jgi:cytidine deaminase
VTPCGRCRQVLKELADLDGGDPVVWSSILDEEPREALLSELLPHSFKL